MIGLPSNTRVWIVAGHTDMRKGFDGLAAVAQTALAANPFCGHVFVLRGGRGDILKVLWFDGQGLMLLAKRLERGRFIWPQATSGSVSLTPAQLSMLNSTTFAASRQTRPADLDIVFASMRRCEAASHADGWLPCCAPVLDPAKLHCATNSRQCQHPSASPTNPRYEIHFDARSTTEVFKCPSVSQRCSISSPKNCWWRPMRSTPLPKLPLASRAFISTSQSG